MTPKKLWSIAKQTMLEDRERGREEKGRERSTARGGGEAWSENTGPCTNKTF